LWWRKPDCGCEGTFRHTRNCFIVLGSDQLAISVAPSHFTGAPGDDKTPAVSGPDLQITAEDRQYIDWAIGRAARFL
jgi:hypothetical protein